jgi:hypothetical protein
VAAGFGSLRHDDVGADVDGGVGVLDVLHLANQLRARGLDLLAKRKRRSERQHHGGGQPRQHRIKQFGTFCQRPGDKTAADPRIPRFGQFAFEPFGVAIAAADQAEAARRRRRGGELAAGGERHRRPEDRMLNVEQFSQSRMQGHQANSAAAPGQTSIIQT